MAEKQKSARRRGTYRGYIATMPFAQDKISGEEVLYEAYIVGGEGEGEMVWPNIWPGEPATFRAAVWPYYQAVERLNLQLLRAFALTLGQGEETFVQHFRQPLSNMSLLHYPGRKPGTPKPDTNDHRDTNTLTVLMPSKVGGLEVQMKSGAFAEVEPIPGCFVVNIGNMMETWSGGRFPSTMHRVLPPEGVERYSMAFFGTPDADTEIFPVGESRLDFMPHRAGDDFARFIAQFDG